MYVIYTILQHTFINQYQLTSTRHAHAIIIKIPPQQDDTGGWWAGINLRTKDTGLFPSNYVTEVSQEQVDIFLNQFQNRRSFVFEEYADSNTDKKSYHIRISAYNDIPSVNPMVYDIGDGMYIFYIQP